VLWEELSVGRSRARLSKLGITRTASQVENGKTLIKGLLPGTARTEDVLHEFRCNGGVIP
jgi:hypothetical protein